MGSLPVLKAVVGKFIQKSSSFLLENVINMAKNVTIRPFARLLTMLGDQLIKNEQIAVIELIKNAYDADADWVKVSFEGFTESLNITPKSRIIIEDNGMGMEQSVAESLVTYQAEGYGLKNVNDRICLLYGEEYKIRITSSVGKGTVVEMRIPKGETS